MDISKLFYFPPFFLNPSIPKGVKATEHATLTLIVLFLFSERRSSLFGQRRWLQTFALCRNPSFSLCAVISSAPPLSTPR